MTHQDKVEGTPGRKQNILYLASFTLTDCTFILPIEQANKFLSTLTKLITNFS